MKFFSSTLLVISLFLCISCGHLNSIETPSEVEQAPPLAGKEELIDRAHTMLLDSEQLSTEQKEQMLLLMEETSEKTQILNEQIYAAKWVLFQSLVGTQKTENKRKRDLLAAELRRLSAQKVDVMIEALYQTEEILGTSTLDFKPSIFLDRHRLSH